MENEKYLFVVSGAAGTGKDSVVKALRTAHPEIEKTVSATTRAPRPGEQEGIDYYYRTTEQFQQLIANDEVVEYNFYNGNYYGTLKEEVNKRLAAGKLVVLVIDVHGAANIRRMFPGATTVFLLPPSVEELERRLRGRGTETEDSIRERLATAQNELAEQDNFTLKLVNNEVEACADLSEASYFLLDTLNQLPPHYRDVLYLFYYEGYKVREISEIKGKNENTIHTWLKRGREALREKLGGELDDFR